VDRRSSSVHGSGLKSTNAQNDGLASLSDASFLIETCELLKVQPLITLLWPKVEFDIVTEVFSRAFIHDVHSAVP
jgi:hypothetical protein